MRTHSSDQLTGWLVAPIMVIGLAVAGANFSQAAAQSTPEASAPVRIIWPIPGAEVVGRDVSVSWQAPGLRIVPAAAAENPTDLHAHFIVDGAYEAVEGAPIPQQCGVLHTAANPAVLTNLPPGEHTVEFVIADPGHVPVPSLGRPQLTIIVGEAGAGATPVAG